MTANPMVVSAITGDVAIADRDDGASLGAPLAAAYA
jgi:hypothetical protein